MLNMFRDDGSRYDATLFTEGKVLAVVDYNRSKQSSI